MDNKEFEKNEEYDEINQAENELANVESEEDIPQSDVIWNKYLTAEGYFLRFTSGVKNHKFNNGEPIFIAIKKIVKDCLILIASMLVLFAVFKVAQFSVKLYTNDDFEVYTYSSTYEKNSKIKINVKGNTNSSMAVFEALADWADVPNVAEKHSGVVQSKTMLANLVKLLPDYSVEYAHRVKNTEYLDRIYKSVVKGYPVVVSISDRETKSFQYAIVTGVDYHENNIYVTFADGIEDVITLDTFVQRTRYADLKDMKSSFSLGLTIGTYDINSAYFIGDKNGVKDEVE